MIGYIRGVAEEIETDAILVDRDGIGLRVYVPASYLDGSVRAGDALRLYTYLHVKEDALTLYGFLTKDEMEIFRMLTGVSGIGPKGALGILSVLGANDLRFAVLSDDAAQIAKAPGIGKKTAQKVILELRDKFDLEDAFEKKLAEQDLVQPQDKSLRHEREMEADVVEALVALGYSGTEALRAVRAVDEREEMDQGALLGAALKRIQR